MKKNTKILLAVLALLAAVGALAGVYLALRPGTQAGAKEVVVTVAAGEKSDEHTLHTDAEYLGQALLDAGLVKGDDGPYGLSITEAGGVPADSAKQEWGCLTKGGEPVNTGVDTTPIADGDRFELTLTTGY